MSNDDIYSIIWTFGIVFGLAFLPLNNFTISLLWLWFFWPAILEMYKSGKDIIKLFLNKKA